MWQVIVTAIIRRSWSFGIMIPFLAMHALAAPRGDGLRPELLALFERHEAASNPHLVAAVSDRRRTDGAETASSRPMSDKAAV